MASGRGGWDLPGSPNAWFGINRDSPQANGLVGWWTGLGRGGWGLLRDALGRYNMTAYNSPTIAGSEFGPVVLFDDASSQYLYSSTPVRTVAPVTLACWFRCDDATTGDQALVGLSSETEDYDGWWLLLETSDNKVQARLNGSGATDQAETSTSFSENTWHHAVAVFASDTLRVAYLDGGGKGTDTASNTPSTVENTTLGGIYYAPGPAVDGVFSGCIAEARIYNRVLSDAEVSALYVPRTRWELYRVPKRVWYVAAGGGSYSLEASAGSLSLTGQAAGLTAARKIAAAQGTLSLSGQATGLTAGRKLTAAQGSISLSGQAAGLTASRLLTAAQGTLSLSGQAAGLIVARLLSAENGTLSLSGQAAALTIARLLTAANGTLTLSGQSVGLTVDRLITAATGTLTLSGQVAGLAVTRKLTAAQGTITLTGQDVSLTHSYPLTAESGTLTLAGQSVGLTIARLLTADVGAIALAGQDATLTYSALLVLSIGPVIRDTSAFLPQLRGTTAENSAQVRSSRTSDGDIRGTVEL